MMMKIQPFEVMTIFGNLGFIIATVATIAIATMEIIATVMDICSCANRHVKITEGKKAMLYHETGRLNLWARE